MQRNSRLSLANAKNKAAQNHLALELRFLETEKQTAIRTLQKEKRAFRSKYSKINSFDDETILKELAYASNLNRHKLKNEDNLTLGDIAGNINQVRNLLFTNHEVDIEKILCLHLVSAHRAECLAPPNQKLLVHMCKIHSPVERLLERSKKKSIHLDQKLTSMLPIYTIETVDVLNSTKKDLILINDGRLASRILLNEKIRELINTVLYALGQTNAKKKSDIFEKANDVSYLKKMMSSRKLLDFMQELNNCAFLFRCNSFILTAPFRVKSIQLEIRTICGSLENLIKRIRHNVLQISTRQNRNSRNDLEGFQHTIKEEKRTSVSLGFRPRMSDSNKDSFLENVKFIYAKNADNYLPIERKVIKHKNKNFIRQNIKGIATAKRIEYDSDKEDEQYMHNKSTTKSQRHSSLSTYKKRTIIERPNIQPIALPVAVVMDVNKEKNADGDDYDTPRYSLSGASFDKRSKDISEEEKTAGMSRKSNKTERRKTNGTEYGSIRIHLKQTTCPACMEKYKIPLPTPKTPRIKLSSILPLILDENSSLKTNSKQRISMLINKETFKLEAYGRRFSSRDERSRRSISRDNMGSQSQEEFNFSPLELAKIEQEIKDKETQKKLEMFLSRPFT